jgi:hypothetical protein
MKVIRAEKIEVFLCDQCAAVHIGLWRDGTMFAEAIPFDPKTFAGALAEAIAESEARQAGQQRERKH